MPSQAPEFAAEPFLRNTEKRAYHPILHLAPELSTGRSHEKESDRTGDSSQLGEFPQRRASPMQPSLSLARDHSATGRSAPGVEKGMYYIL